MVGNFQWKFQVEEDIFHQLLLVSEKLNNSLTWGIKISAVCSVVSSQSTRVSDRQTNRQSDRQSGRQYYDPQDLTRIAALRGKIYGMIRPFYLTVADRRLLRNYRFNASREKLNISSSDQRRDKHGEDFLFIPIPINSTFYAWLIATKSKIKLSVIPN